MNFVERGHGDSLLAMAEQEVMRGRFQWVYLATFSFQAPKFYQERGYVIFGEFPDFLAGHRRFFLKKVLWVSSSQPQEVE